ncbi:sulfotransferase domain-containing protein [Bacteroidales bacterium]|nr:sulfotransferase domain-containing protein [Bacteroidales bacterium]
MPNKNLIWLASYPKSGNTWFRIILSNLLSDNENQIDINNLERTPIASSRDLFDEHAPICASELTHREIDLYRPQVYRSLSNSQNKTAFLKVHDSYHKNYKQKAIFPTDVSIGAIYIVRNPLDIVASFSNHLNRNIDSTIKLMNSPDFAFAEGLKGLPQQLRQQIGSWSGHVQSWISQTEIPICIVRYEDMLNDTFTTLKKVLSFCKLNNSDGEIIEAIKKSSFEHIKKQEATKGFKERPLHTPSFFRKGKHGNYKHELSHIQINKIIEYHGEIMEQLQYLP